MGLLFNSTERQPFANKLAYLLESGVKWIFHWSTHSLLGIITEIPLR